VTPTLFYVRIAEAKGWGNAIISPSLRYLIGEMDYQEEEEQL
jgi:hypothetical protein